MIKLLANENFHLASILILEKEGFDIRSVGRDFSGTLDSQIIGIANSEGRTIVTFDRDYGELIFKRGIKPECGVIFLRWDDFSPADPGNYLIELFKSDRLKFNRKLTVISETHIRQRSYEI